MLSVQIDRIIPLDEAKEDFEKIVSTLSEESAGNNLFILTRDGKPAVAVVNIGYLSDITGDDITASEDFKTAQTSGDAPRRSEFDADGNAMKQDHPQPIPPIDEPGGVGSKGGTRQFADDVPAQPSQPAQPQPAPAPSSAPGVPPLTPGTPTTQAPAPVSPPAHPSEPAPAAAPATPTAGTPAAQPSPKPQQQPPHEEPEDLDIG